VLGIILLFLMGCVSTMPVQKLNPATYYVNDICFTYKNKGEKDIKFCGVGTLPYAESYDLKIENKGKLNFFSMTSCHRENTTENYDASIFKKDGVIKIKYTPATLEKGKACSLFVAAFNRKGKHGWGAIYFEHPRFKLKSIIKCNGKMYAGRGVSVCQSREGLWQQISFWKEVVPLRPVNGASQRKKDCPKLNTKDNKLFKFLMPGRECTYGFVEKGSRNVHMFNTVGYEQLIIRE